MGAKKPTYLVQSLSYHIKRCSFVWPLKVIKGAIIALAICLVAIGIIDRWVTYQTQDQLYFDVKDIPHFDVAVVLGTSKYLGRTLNDYYIHRIDTAIKLYQQGKINRFLLSGDNAHRSYNEPWTMKRDLLRANIPEERIFLDYAGFRTLDSVVRAKAIFATDDFLIISQKFHCERALYIANYHKINARCLAVPGPERSNLLIRLREVFARTKAFLDLYIIDTQPRFLGPQEPIPSLEEAEADSALMTDMSLKEQDLPPSAASSVQPY